MGLFTLLTTNVRAKRAGVVLYALILFSLAAYGSSVLVSDSVRVPIRTELAPFLPWATIIIGIIAIGIVMQVSRGKLDARLNWISVWLGMANIAILALYVAVFWQPIVELLRK